MVCLSQTTPKHRKTPRQTSVIGEAQTSPDAFGNITSDSATTTEALFKFTARPYDEDGELQNNLNRWYELSTGRWMSMDPIGFQAGDVNLYRYVGNGPQRVGDPTGLDVYLETGNDTGDWANDSLHQSICVDYWKPDCTGYRGKRCYSFGKIEGMEGLGVSIGTDWLGVAKAIKCCALIGEVYKTDGPVEDAVVVRRKKTTCQEDRQFWSFLEHEMRGTRDGYSAFMFNCRSFSQGMFEMALGTEYEWKCIEWKIVEVTTLEALDTTMKVCVKRGWVLPEPEPWY